MPGSVCFILQEPSFITFYNYFKAWYGDNFSFLYIDNDIKADLEWFCTSNFIGKNILGIPKTEALEKWRMSMPGKLLTDFTALW